MPVKRLATNVACKEAYKCLHSGLLVPVKRPTRAGKEAYYCLQRGLLVPVKRLAKNACREPTHAWNETY
jgi:hypothetical protein